MADEDQDDSQKTEEPSQKRLEDALQKGQVANSREVTSFFMLLVFALTIVWLSPSIAKKASYNLVRYIESPHTFVIDSVSITAIASDALFDVFTLMMLPISIIVMMIIFSSLIQHPLIFSTDSPSPKLERISPLKGIKRIFSMKSFVEFLKGLFKIIAVGVIIFLAIYPDLSLIIQLPLQNIGAITLLVLRLATKAMIGVCCFMGIIAAIDFLYQQFEHTKSLRMSKRDIKDEFKQTEGNPEIKAKLREIRNKRANERMMSNVPSADVVITNPTHYSIALKYDSKVSEAPIVVAKGMDFIALKIREVAKENNVPIVENPPLARALFASVEIEQEVPLEHYAAVAEVIRYIYKLKGKRSA